MDNTNDEEKIFSIIDSHRNKAFEYVSKEMYQAFDEIGQLLAANSLRNINKKKINGIMPATIRELYRLGIEGKSSREADQGCRQRWFIEFIKAQSLSYEAQKARYPNFLKQWTEEEEEKLESLWCEGISDKEISDILMRHPNSISARIAKLGLVEKYKI